MDEFIMTKPTILIYTVPGVDQAYFQELLYGMEEESIPWEILSKMESDVYQLADVASRESALGVGIGVDNNHMILSYKNLPAHTFIYRLKNYKQQKDSLRILGVNAARLAKGNPFKYDERLEVAF